MNNQSKKSKFFGTKTDLKKKTENPNESVMNRSVIAYAFQQMTLVTRYFVRKVSCHAIELFIDYEHRCLTPCKLHSCSLTEFFLL